ncbi:IS3 family transposase [Streptomyces sp. NPDC008222]|uniref:IS3 family transposase n=1 Tax=Streptomyces sp. NPDC008222 TaxID=3364820 RepID=UPI0036E34DDA
MCRALKVSRSGYYAWLAARPASERREREEREPITEIRKIHHRSRRAHGAPRVTAALRRAGRRINEKKVARLMRKHGLQGVTRRKRRGLTRPDKKAAPAPGPDRPRLHRGQAGHQAGLRRRLPAHARQLVVPPTVIDLAAREVIGYAMADHHRAELVVDALAMAAGRGRLRPGRITHSDRGSEYTSSEYRSLVRKLEVRQSMGRTGSCYNNTAAESFFGLTKAEIGTTVWPSHEAARADVFRFIEVEYNLTRLRKHPEYGYVTPVQTRTLTTQDLTPAA